MLRKGTIFALWALLLCLSTPAISAGRPGMTGTVFNRRFIHRLKPMMPYDQLAGMIGAQGRKVAEDNRSTPPKIAYHWDGGRKSALDVRVAAGKVVDATVTSPRGQRFSLGKKGELIDLGD